MIIRLHRWQAKHSRYRTQIFNSGVDEQSCFVDILARTGTQVGTDPSVKQVICRTQQIDRVLSNSIDGTVDVYMSPFIERNYPERRVSKGTA